MTAKEKEYVLEYLANGYNAQKAYNKVYKKPDGTKSGYAYDILAKPEIKQYIREYRRKKLEALNVDNERIIEKLTEIAFAEKGDDYYKSADQIKALDLLQKMLSDRDGKEDMIIKVKIDE